MNHVKLLKGQPRRFALWELVPNSYQSFPPVHFGQAEMNESTMLSNKTSTAESCAEDQILEYLILRTSFKYLYWTISKTISWNLAISKWSNHWVSGGSMGPRERVRKSREATDYDPIICRLFQVLFVFVAKEPYENRPFWRKRPGPRANSLSLALSLSRIYTHPVS